MASDPTTRPVSMRPGRLWLGVVTAGAAWFALGIAEMFITWRACMHNEQFGNSIGNGAAMGASFVVSFLLLGLVAAAGFASWIAWRKASAQRSLVEAEGRTMQEFLPLVGVFFCLTLGVGMVWMTLPLFILRLCARVR